MGKKEENNNQLEIRVRSIQIVITSLLSYYTIRLDIYKHQKLSLIVICFLLVLIIIFEFFMSSNTLTKFLSLLFCIISCLFRAFLDVTEKYLFDFNFINNYKMLINEGLIGIILFIIFFISSTTYQKHRKNILKDMSEFDWNLISFILLIDK